MYFGVYFGDLRGFAFCTGRRRSQTLILVARQLWRQNKGKPRDTQLRITKFDTSNQTGTPKC